MAQQSQSALGLSESRLFNNVDGGDWGTSFETREVQRTKRFRSFLVGGGCDHQVVEWLVNHNKAGMYLKLAELAAYVCGMLSMVE